MINVAFLFAADEDYYRDPRRVKIQTISGQVVTCPNSTSEMQSLYVNLRGHFKRVDKNFARVKRLGCLLQDNDTRHRRSDTPMESQQYYC